MGDTVTRNIEDTKLYRHIEKAAKGDTDFLYAVKALCKEAESYTTQIVRFFPTFTRHDYTHSIGVCDWMAHLLNSMTDAEGKATAWDNLTAEEAALLLLAAYWHDTGMAVTDAEEKSLLADMEARVGNWAEYFGKHPDDALALTAAEDRDAERARILRNFVREHHAARCAMHLPTEDAWSSALEARGIYRRQLKDVCRSHGLWMEDLPQGNDEDEFDLRLCAVLLRLADLLDYDASRAPESLYRFLGLGKPESTEEKKSQTEWNKNRNFGFKHPIKDGIIIYRATFIDEQTRHGVLQYLDWVRSELHDCQTYFAHDRWQGYHLPHAVEDKSKCKGFDAGDFQITMDQDRVLELLTGKNLYDDAGVFVRELLQNSIDAVLARRKLDKDFGEDNGEIHIFSWQDGDYDWFRIEDDGVGMNKHIIQEHFLKVGHSYYESAEYKDAIGEKSGEFQPISRFGIGILSCFMSDGNNTRLSLSTRRYDETQPLLMEVNGLHGYYNLAALKLHEREGNPLPTPYYWMEERRSKTEVGRGVGTTICVRVNRYNLGYASFRELLDRYVMFPTVKITYHNRNASHTYPTQGELMKLVHSLNEPDGTAKTYVVPPSNEMFEWMRQEGISRKWMVCTKMTLRFHSLDKITESISGVQLELGRQRNEDKSMLHVLDYTACKALRLVLDATRDSRDACTVTAYNGVTADRRDLLNLSDDSPAVLLLGDDHRPSVNLARNEITALPLDTLCVLALMNNEGHRDSTLFAPEHFALLPEKAWREVLARHEDWETMHIIDERTLDSLVKESRANGKNSLNCWFESGSVYDHLRLTVLNRRFELCQSDDHTMRLTRRDSEETASELPVSLCVKWSEAVGRLGNIKGYALNRYSHDHPFFQWLLRERAALAEKVPAIYQGLLKTMVLGKDKDTVRGELNDALERLSRFPSDPFETNSVPRLTKEDFIGMF